MCRRSGLSDLKRRFPSPERMRQMSPFCGALSLSLSLSRRCNPLYLLFKCLDTSWRTNKREFFPIFGSWFELSLPPSRSRAKFQPIRDPVNTSRELSSSRKLRSAISLYTSPLEHYPKDVTTDITSGRITILYTWKGKKKASRIRRRNEIRGILFERKKKKRGLGRVGIQGFGYKGYRREGRKETKRRIEFYSMHKMNGGRRGGVKSDFIREIRHHSTTHRGGTGFLRRRGEFSYLLLLLLSVVWALRTYESKYGGSGCGASTANDSGCEWRSEWLWKHPRHQPRLPVFLL